MIYSNDWNEYESLGFCTNLLSSYIKGMVARVYWKRPENLTENLTPPSLTVTCILVVINPKCLLMSDTFCWTFLKWMKVRLLFVLREEIANALGNRCRWSMNCKICMEMCISRNWRFLFYGIVFLCNSSGTAEDVSERFLAVSLHYMFNFTKAEVYQNKFLPITQNEFFY